VPPAGAFGYDAPMKLDATVPALLEAGERRRAVELIMHELGPSVRGLLHTIFRANRDAAEESFSLFAENLWRHATTYRGESTVKAWVYCIARNAAVTVTRDGWRRLGRHLETMEAERLAEEVRTRSALRLERQSSALESLRDLLDMDEQTLLTLRLDEKLPWDQVAQVMSSGSEPVDAATLRKRFERVKVRLGEEARRRGLV